MDKLKVEMQSIIQTLKDDNVALMKENASLKRQIGGYKTANENYKKQVAELKGRVGHYKALDLEGDHLYEDKIAELDDARKEIERLKAVRNNVVPKKDYEELEKTLESKKVFIERLQERVQTLSLEKATLESTISLQDGIIKDLEGEIEQMSKPWWKRLFQ
jgi:chromosome segregation ATPase